MTFDLWVWHITETFFWLSPSWRAQDASKPGKVIQVSGWILKMAGYSAKPDIRLNPTRNTTVLLVQRKLNLILKNNFYNKNGEFSCKNIMKMKIFHQDDLSPRSSSHIAAYSINWVSDVHPMYTEMLGPMMHRIHLLKFSLATGTFPGHWYWLTYSLSSANCASSLVELVHLLR